MRRLISPLGFWFLGFLLLVSPQPGALWYKHSASPRYHTVGRASGLLIGVRRSPYLWRRDVLTGQQGAEEKTAGIYGLWRGAGTDHQLYPDPGEKSTLLEKLYRNLEEGRSLGDSKEMVQGGENLAEVGWSVNKLDEEKNHFEEQSWLAGDQDIVERRLGENKAMVMEPAEEEETGLEEQSSAVKDPELVKKSVIGNSLLAMEPGEEKRMLEESWLINYPGEQAQSLKGEQMVSTEPVDEAKSYDRETRGQQKSGGDKAPNSEDIWPMSLKKYLRAYIKAYPQPWRRHLPREEQPFYNRSKISEWIHCEDLAWTSTKILCRGSLHPHSWFQPRRQSSDAEDPSTPL